MTNKDARKLRRTELLELLIEQTEENERLAGLNAQLEEKLSQRVLQLERAGSIAEAALGLSGVFDQAQDAANRYLESIAAQAEQAEQALAQAREQAQALLEKTSEECAQQRSQTQSQCEELERQTREKCQQLLAEAEQQAAALAQEELTPPQGQMGRFLRR